MNLRTRTHAASRKMLGLTAEGTRPITSRFRHRLMRHPLIGVCLILIGSASALPTLAADSAFPDIQRILNAGVIRVAILDKDVPPMIMTAKDGSPAGAEADLARDLADKLGVEVKFLRSATTYDEVVEQVGAKQADLGVSFLSSGVGRALQVYFSRPYIDQSGRVFFNRTALARLKRDHDIEALHEIERLAGIDSLRFGVVEGSIYQSLLERDFADFQIETYASLPELMQAVRNNEIFGGVNGGLQIAYYMRRHPSTAIHVAVDPQLRSTSDICIAVRPDAPNLLRWVNVYLAGHQGLQDSNEIVARYLQQDEQPDRAAAED